MGEFYNLRPQIQEDLIFRLSCIKPNSFHAPLQKQKVHLVNFPLS